MAKIKITLKPIEVEGEFEYKVHPEEYRTLVTDEIINGLEYAMSMALKDIGGLPKCTRDLKLILQFNIPC